jgi:hypothetical protein
MELNTIAETMLQGRKNPRGLMKFQPSSVKYRYTGYTEKIRGRSTTKWPVPLTFSPALEGRAYAQVLDLFLLTRSR